MRLFVVGEGPGDEEFALGIARCVAGSQLAINSARRRTRARGWSALRRQLPRVITEAHYRGIDAVLVVADSDDCGIDDRRADLLTIASARVAELPKRRGMGPVRVAVGLAAPAIEAWYRLGEDPQVTEAAWRQKLRIGKCGYDRRSLKRAVYGTTNPTVDQLGEAGRAQAERLCRELDHLSKVFPTGFAPFHRELRGLFGGTSVE